MSEKKKLGSVSNVNQRKKPSLWDRIWEQKEYFLIGFLVLIVIVIYFVSFRKIAKRTTEGITPTPTVSLVENAGQLEVNTEPPEALVQFNQQTEETPHTFENIIPGKYIIIISHRGYKAIHREVEIKPGEKTVLDLKLQN
ncbi:MAG: PEGA domain-containing protein [Vulcanimicrobiota bacterium]